MAGAQRPPRCMLFELSAELRNQIYEYVLVDAFYDGWVGHFTVDRIGVYQHTGLAVPSILQTCRQTRQEAAQIYFKQNTFVIVLNRSNSDFLQAWLAMAVSHVGSSPRHRLLPQCKFTYRDTMDPDRDNILKWCKLVHEDRLPVTWAEGEEGDHLMPVSALPILVAGQQLAEQYKARPWKDFLSAYRTLCYAVELTRQREQYW